MTKDYIHNFFVLLLICIAFFFLNHAIPFMADDAAYARYFPEVAVHESINGTELDHPIQSFGEIIESMCHHYFTLNGRSLIHIPVQLICGLWHNKIFYDILASLLIVAQILLLSKICDESRINKWIGFVVVLLMWLLYVEPSSMLMGVAYGMNYVYVPTLCLLFIYLFLRNDNNSVIPSILLCLIAFPAGWSHEGFVVPIGAALLYYLFCNRKNASKAQWIAFLLFCAGALFLILAPGNFRKAKIFSGLIWQSRMNVIYYSRISYLLLACCGYMFIKHRDTLIAYIKNNAFWFIAWVVGICFIAYIGALNERAVFAYELFAAILLVKMANAYWNQDRKWINVCKVSSVLLLLGFCALAYCQNSITKQFKSCESQLASLNENGDVLIVVPDAITPECLDRYLCSPLRHHYERIWQEEWQWTVYAWLYRKESVTILSESQAPIFTDEYKEPGNNPFYRRGRYLYSTEELPSSLSCKLHLGDYNIMNPEGAIKKVGSFIKRPSTNEVDAEMNIESLVFGNDTIYRICLPEKAVRYIKAIDCNEQQN